MPQRLQRTIACGVRCVDWAPDISWKWRRSFRHNWLAATARMINTSKYFMSILQEGRDIAARQERTNNGDR
jgi:hypothetical protein